MIRAKNILVVKNRALGDSIMGISTVKYVKECFPQSRIIYAIPGWVTPLYASIKTDADQYLAIDLNSLKSCFALWKELKSQRIDLIYEMHQAGRTGKFFKIYSLLNQIPYFYHNHHLKSGTKVFDQGVIKPLIQRDLDGVCSFLSDRSNPPHYLSYPPIIKVDKIQPRARVILGVVAARETKIWPIKNYINLIKLITNNFPTIEIAIPISNSNFDKNLQAEIICHHLPSQCKIVNLNLSELPRYFAESKIYIGNDTGLKHLAVAVNIKTFTFFGPEPYLEWHPYDTNFHQFFYKEDLECRTKYQHYCGLSTCPDMDCLNKFSAEAVFATIKKYLS